MSTEGLTPTNETSAAGAIRRQILDEKLNKGALMDIEPFQLAREVATRFQDEGWVRQDPNDGTWSVVEPDAFASQVRSAITDLKSE